MNFFTSADIRRIENEIMETFAVSESVLMENAGSAAAEIIMNRFPSGEILVLTGPGKNGGDGYVAARHLASRGRRVEILSAIPAGNLKGISEENFRRAVQCGFPVSFSPDWSDEKIAGKIRHADILVDSLLGIGSKGLLRGEIARLCLHLKDTENVIALDIPTGIDPDSGHADIHCAGAALTITMICPKTGIATGEGKKLAGEIIVAGVGFPVPINAIPRIRSFSAACGKPFLPQFPYDIHKGMRGGAMVIGGCTTYRGAPLLSLRGFLRAGGGPVVLFSDEISCASCSTFLPEAILENNLFSKSDGEVVSTLSSWSERIGTIVLGPGIGRSERAGEICSLVFSAWKGNIIIDGDGLFWLSKCAEKHHRGNILLTPHEGEAARLLGVLPEAVRKDRLASARRIAEEWGPVLLKGAETLCDDGRETYLVAEGNRALAVPGSGDVLAGVIAAFLSAGTPLLESAALGAYVHGKSAQSLASSNGCDGILAREIADEIPHILKEMRDPLL
ncbi:NAD(P)H-hydrate dehydratase [Aminivibrio sp.]|uniref:NAD(P)H-hydrate dehydratase n=1 Tax=Aminivibrio sp. TaxID=1872489 RepID=UPI00345E95A2